LGQAQKGGGVKSVNGTPSPPNSWFEQWW
jgi:hypothetical protein